MKSAFPRNAGTSWKLASASCAPNQCQQAQAWYEPLFTVAWLWMYRAFVLSDIAACMQPATRRHLHTIADDGMFDSEVPAAVFASLSLNEDEDDSGTCVIVACMQPF
jgi:hypothetical protein